MKITILFTSVIGGTQSLTKNFTDKKEADESIQRLIEKTISIGWYPVSCKVDDKEVLTVVEDGLLEINL